MSRLPRLLASATALVLATAAGARAESHVRAGFCAGFGMGLESVSWNDVSDERRVEASGVVTARAGWALKPTLVAGVEFWGWAKEYEVLTSSGGVPVNVQLSATTAALTWYPGADGIFFRLGAGLAYGKVDIDAPSGSGAAAAETGSKTGLAVLFAPGYEFRVTKHFALGAQGDIVYMGLSEPLDDAFGYGLNVQFNWYW